MEKQVAYSQQQFGRPQKPACCLTVLGFPEDMSHRSNLALEMQDFSYCLLPPCIVSTPSEVGGLGSKRISAIFWKGEEGGGGRLECFWRGN